MCRLAHTWREQAGDRARAAGLGCRQEGSPEGMVPCSPFSARCAPGWWDPWDMALGLTGGSGAVTGVWLNSDSPAPSRWSQGPSPGRAGPGRSSPAPGQGWGWGQDRHTSAHSCPPLPRHSPSTPYPCPPGLAQRHPSPFQPHTVRGGRSHPSVPYQSISLTVMFVTSSLN